MTLYLIYNILNHFETAYIDIVVKRI